MNTTTKLILALGVVVALLVATVTLLPRLSAEDAAPASRPCSQAQTQLRELMERPAAEVATDPGGLEEVNATTSALVTSCPVPTSRQFQDEELGPWLAGRSG